MTQLTVNYFCNLIYIFGMFLTIHLLVTQPAPSTTCIYMYENNETGGSEEVYCANNTYIKSCQHACSYQ